MLAHFQPLIDTAVTRAISAGSTILYQGEIPRSACIVVQGVVRVSGISKQGDEQIVLFHVAGDCFPSPWIFGKSPSTLFFYEALTDCTIAFVPKQTLLDFLYADTGRMQSMIDYFATQFSASMIRINALEQSKARDKLMYTLYYLCQRYNKQQAGKVHIPLTLTHQSLASLVGLTRETTAMELNKLKKQGVISYHNQEYTVFVAKLLELMGEDSFKDLTIAG